MKLQVLLWRRGTGATRSVPFPPAVRYHRGNREREMCSRHTGATLWSAADVETPALLNNQMHHLSPRAKNQQLSSDWFRCKCCSHKRWKMTLVSHFLTPPPPQPPLCSALQIKWSVCDSLMLAEATASRALDCKCSLRGPAPVWYT